MRDAPTKLRMHTPEYLIHANHDTIDRGNLTSKGARPVDPVTTELGLVREHAFRYKVGRENRQQERASRDTNSWSVVLGRDLRTNPGGNT